MSKPAGDAVVPMDALLDTFGSARSDRAPVHRRRPGTDDATVTALGKLSAALEVAEDARGHLYAFHRLSGRADLDLADAVESLRDCGHPSIASIITEVLLGRDVIAGRWTFELVEDYDENYLDVFRAVEKSVRAAVGDVEPHLAEAEMKSREQGPSSDPLE